MVDETLAPLAPCIEGSDDADAPDRRGRSWPVARVVPPHPATLGWSALALLVGAAPATIYPTFSAFYPTYGVDSSWITGINLAAGRRMRFGHDIVFTYGPWGFLNAPLAFDPWHTAAAFAFTLAVAGATFAVAYAALRRVWQPAASAPAAFVLTATLVTLEPGMRLVCAGVIAAIMLLERRHRDPSGTRLDLLAAPGFAAVAALLLQLKFSEGLAMLAVAGCVAVFGLRPRDLVRTVPAAAVAYTLAFLVAWFGAGQRAGDLLPWVRGSLEISSGYVEAMAREYQPHLFGYVAAGALAAAVLVAGALVVRRGRDGAALGVLLLALAMLEFGFKQGFTRHDIGHEFAFFALAGASLVGMSRWLRRPRPALIAALCALLMVFGGLTALDPANSRERLRRGTDSVLNSEYRDQQLAAAATAAQQHYQISARVLSAVAAHPVQIDPFETTAAWAYSLNWRPVPVLQPYSAYTPYLDQLDANALLTAPVDQMVLRNDRAVGIDRRNARWDSPRYQLVLACNYTAVVSDPNWTVLRRATNRCDAPQTLATVRVGAGERIPVPGAGAGQLVLARFVPAAAGLVTRVVNAVVKDWSPSTVVTDTGHYRIPEAMTGGPLMVSVPAVLGWQGLYAPVSYRWLAFNAPGTVQFQAVQVH